ncbi:hypothetical protein GCM10023165_27540 [Variovorax defluvii]|uniref:Tetratricopeptide repeat protein n=2 Tax=Variovorax defluvii TaxID=913761 RepID=A0ABP8HU04_9BURK
MDFDLSKLSSEVEQLCEQGDFRSALPLSLQLFVQDHREPSAAFLLGSCLQRLDQPGLALAAFVQCTELEGELPTPAPLLRTGECLAALQMPQEAVAAFDRAVDLARSRPQDGDIQSMAAAKADVLRRNL